MADKFILEDGQPVPCDDYLAWAHWFETSDRQIAIDQIGDVRISTVFLGLDHSFGRGAPLLFETMIFGGAHDEYQERYSTREDAVAGHAVAVARVNAEARPALQGESR